MEKIWNMENGRVDPFQTVSFKIISLFAIVRISLCHFPSFHMLFNKLYHFAYMCEDISTSFFLSLSLSPVIGICINFNSLKDRNIYNRSLL